MTKGSWVRFGIQQTPLLDYEEGIYRYRFQGTIVHRARGLPDNSSDAGALVPLQLPDELRRHPRRRLQRRGLRQDRSRTIRRRSRSAARSGPSRTAAPVLRGLRLTGFYDADNYVKNAERTRGVGAGDVRAQVPERRRSTI